MNMILYKNNNERKSKYSIDKFNSLVDEISNERGLWRN